MASVTENWSDRQISFGVRGQRGWIVTPVAGDVTDEDTARSAVGSDAELNAEMPGDSRLKLLDEAEVRKIGPMAWHVLAQFVRADSRPTSESDPLSQKTRFFYQVGNKTEIAVADAQGTPILNSVGLRGDIQEPRTETLVLCRAMKWQTDFDLSVALAFTNSINDEEVELPRAGTVYPGQMYCEFIQPNDEFDLDTSRFRIVYQFQLARGNVVDADGFWDAFKHRVPDRSYSGVYSDGGKLKRGAFVDGNNDPVTEPVMLDGFGKPLDTTILIANNRTPIAYQSSTTPYDIEEAVDAVYLKYWKFPRRDFNSLGIF